MPVASYQLLVTRLIKLLPVASYQLLVTGLIKLLLVVSCWLLITTIIQHPATAIYHPVLASCLLLSLLGIKRIGLGCAGNHQIINTNMFR